MPDAECGEHRWKKEYYGYVCEDCGAFMAFGSEPWAPDDQEADWPNEFDGDSD